MRRMVDAAVDSRLTAPMSDSPPEPLDDDTPTPVAPQNFEVRYALKELLREVESERQQSALGREMVDQMEIQDFFKKRREHARRRRQQS